MDLGFTVILQQFVAHPQYVLHNLDADGVRLSLLREVQNVVVGAAVEEVREQLDVAHDRLAREHAHVCSLLGVAAAETASDQVYENLDHADAPRRLAALLLEELENLLYEAGVNQRQHERDLHRNVRGVGVVVDYLVVLQELDQHFELWVAPGKQQRGQKIGQRVVVVLVKVAALQLHKALVQQNVLQQNQREVLLLQAHVGADEQAHRLEHDLHEARVLCLEIAQVLRPLLLKLVAVQLSVDELVGRVAQRRVRKLHGHLH